MKKVIAASVIAMFATVGLAAPAQAANVVAAKAKYGDSCKKLKEVAKGRGADGSNLVCKKETAGTYKGKQIWGYAKYPVLKDLDFKIGASLTSGYAGFTNEVTKALKAEGLVVNTTMTPVLGSSGVVALNDFILKDAGKGGQILTTGYAMILGNEANNGRNRVSDGVGAARLMGEYEAIVVPADSPIKTIGDLVNAIKADLKTPIAGGSINTLDHVAALTFYKEAGLGVKNLNFVPHSGGGEVIASLLSGATKVGISGWGEFDDQVAAGKLRVLGITAATKQARIPAETVVSQGVNLVIENWRGLMLPVGTSAANRNLVIRALDVMRAGTSWKASLTTNEWTDNYIVGSAFDTFLKNVERQAISIFAELRS